jgi:hypothetical protein
MVTISPLLAAVGVNWVIVGGTRKTNPALVALPPGVLTETSPVAPVPITANIVVAFITLNELAAEPPNLTDVAPVKFVPDMVTVSPLAAFFGVKLLIEGAAIKAKPAIVAVPPGLITEISPVAPAPTTACMLVALITLNELAAALGDDANFSTTVTNSISEKISKIGNETISGVKTFTVLPESSSVPATNNQITNKTMNR